MDNRQTIEAKLKTLRSDTRAFKNTYDEQKYTRTWESCPIQNKKETIPKSIGADRDTAYGGDLERRGCTNLLQNVDTFFT